MNHDHTRSDAKPPEAPRAPAGPGWVARIEELAAARGLRLTTLRHDMLAILGDAIAPLGAYEIIDRLALRQRRTVAPITVYRTLDFLVEAGFVVKIESRQAYVACDHPGHAHHGALLICTRCGATDEIEVPDTERALGQAARGTGFEPQRQIIEIEGTCAACGVQGSVTPAACD
jgi:Fur family zinc uptake transcriptional regulator